MLVDEIAEYLGDAGLGLTVGVNLWKVPVPETAVAPTQVSVVEYGGRPALRAMGPSLGDPVAEVTRFQVGVIGQLSDYAATRGLAEGIYQALDNLTDTRLPDPSGPRYLLVKALQPPFYFPPGEMGDPNAQHHFSCNFEAMRERT